MLWTAHTTTIVSILTYLGGGAHTDKPTLKELSNLLQGVDWHQLGINLTVPPGVLRNIEEDYQKADRRRSEVVLYTLDNCSNPTWEMFAAAVEGMGHSNLATIMRGQPAEDLQSASDGI